jgi:hypothetical protein
MDLYDFKKLNFGLCHLKFSLTPPSTGTSPPSTKTPSSSPFATKTWSKPSFHEEIGGDFSLSYHIMDNFNPSAS